MTRPVAQTHLSQLSELFSWMDEKPERKSLAPEARTPEGLWWEVMAGEDDHAWVNVEDGKVLGYAAMFPFWEGVAVEGPVVRGGDGKDLLARAVRTAKAKGHEVVYAFPEMSNKDSRQLLESEGFEAQHATLFYSIGKTDLSFDPPDGYDIRLCKKCDAKVYRELFAKSEENWSLRLSWSDEELDEHFMDANCKLFFAYRGDVAVGMAELEMGDFEAEVAYIGVVPEHRSKGLGRALLGACSEWAFTDPAVEVLRVRAHEYEKEAQKLYKKLGFKPKESVVTYALELE